MLRKNTRAPIGYVRDRSAVYKEKWQALHPNRGASAASHAAADRLGQAFRSAEEARLLGDSGATSSDIAVEMLPVQNPLMAAEQRINAELERAKADLATLSHLQSAAQEDLFGRNAGNKEAVEERRGELRGRIRAIHGMINDLGPADSRDADAAAVAARVKRAKATALNEIAMELNRKEIADIQSRAPHGVPGMDRSRMDAVFSQLAEPTPAYAEQQMQQLTNMQHAYAQRDEAVAELIKEVTEIQEVMRDISVLVVEQGSMVDRIDQNVEAAAEAVDRGVEHIRKAHESSKNGAMATCIFVLLIMIAIMFVLMVIVKVV